MSNTVRDRKVVIALLALLSSVVAGCTSSFPSELEVVNAATITIYVWIDGEYKGSIPVGASQTWEVTADRHNLRVTKSSNYDDSPAERFVDTSSDSYTVTVYDW